MKGRLRYRVTRTLDGWAVIDRSKAKIMMHNDVVAVFKARTPARMKAAELNLAEEQPTPIATGDAA